LPTTIGQELDTARSDEQAATATEDSSKVVLDNADATSSGIELQSEHEQETLIPSSQETGVDVVSSSKDALTAHGVETEVEADTHGTDAATTWKNDLTEEHPVTEQPVIPTTEVFIFNSCGNALANLVLPL
jgi:hypothetical protein